MNHGELMKVINNQNNSEDKRRRGITLSMLEAIRSILIEKNIVSETEFNNYYDENLKRNFSIKD